MAVTIEYLWQDRKRHLGLPISFTRYALSEDRLFLSEGFLNIRDDEVLLYRVRDIAPQAPTHILVIPKTHIASVDGITQDNSAMVAHIFQVIPAIAKAEGLAAGYRVVSNCGADAGQTVHHLHFHILGGRQLTLEMA